MNEILFPIAIAIVISAVVGFLTTGLKRLKSVEVKVDFTEEDDSKRIADRPTRKLSDKDKEKFLP